jgi:hypothetical protein
MGNDGRTTEKAEVSCHAIRILIRRAILPAKQYVFDAPWQQRAGTDGN